MDRVSAIEAVFASILVICTDRDLYLLPKIDVVQAAPGWPLKAASAFSFTVKNAEWQCVVQFAYAMNFIYFYLLLWILLLLRNDKNIK